MKVIFLVALRRLLLVKKLEYIQYILLGIVSFSLMAFEFLLSKELAYIYTIRSSTFLIPLIMVGFCFGSAVSKRVFKKDPTRAKIILAISGSMLISLFMTTHIIFHRASQILSATPLLLIWPFLFYGVYFGKVFSESKNLKMVFLINGLGLVLGAVFSGKIFRYMGSDGGFCFVNVVLLLTVLLFAKGIRKFAVLILCLFIGTLQLNTFRVNDGTSAIFAVLNAGDEIIKTEFSEFIRTDVVKIGDRSKKNKYIYNDGGSPTSVFKKNKNFSVNKDSLTFLPYLFRKYTNALIIGTGGGNDIAAALAAGVSDIVGIELNSATIRLMKEDFSEYSGNLYKNPKVKIINAEGRGYIQTSKDDTFDLIVLRGTDLAATAKFFNSIGAIEGYLYTQEAILQYWKKLSDNGMLFFTRAAPAVSQCALLQILRIYKAIKTVSLTKDISKHIIVTKTVERPPHLKRLSQDAYSLLLSKNEFTPDVYDQIASSNREIYYFPNVINRIDQIYSRKSKTFNIEPLTDDKPSFYHFRYWSQVLKPLIWIVLPVLFIPLFCLSLITKSRRMVNAGILFILLGIAYIALEINIMEKITLSLGNPLYAVQVGLSSFLLFGGFGGYYGVSLKRNRFAIFCFILFLTNLIYIGIFAVLPELLSGLPQWMKIISAFFVIGPFGFLAGIPFAIVLSKQKERHIMYALDGVGTVVGSMLIWFSQNHFGFNMSFISISILYLLITIFYK